MAEHASNAETIDVAYVARLARLNLTPDEVATFQGQLEQIVHYVHEIAEVDLSGIEPTSHAQAVLNVFRADAVKPWGDNAAFLANAPERMDDQFQVPKIVE